jgi:hypothetical protein
VATVPPSQIISVRLDPFDLDRLDALCAALTEVRADGATTAEAAAQIRARPTTRSAAIKTAINMTLGIHA